MSVVLPRPNNPMKAAQAALCCSLFPKWFITKSSNHHTCGIKKFYTTRLACRSLKIVTYHQRIKRRNRHKENHTICSGESQNEKPLIHQKNPDCYFRKYESQIILFAGAEHILQENGMNLKHLNTNKLQEQLSDLIFQKKITKYSICFF